MEGTHFERAWLPPRELGRRAVVVAASDLAAMVAEPHGIVVAISLPLSEPERFFRQLFRGIVEGAHENSLEIFGGNLAVGPLSISITAIGSSPENRLVRRRGTELQDSIFATGNLGRAGLGRMLLAAGEGSRGAAARAAIRAFRRPQARIREALRLQEKVEMHSLIDISDGLAADLAHLLRAGSQAHESQAGTAALMAILREEALLTVLESDTAVSKRSSRFADLAKSMDVDPLALVLEGGEDYEILFTVPARCETAVAWCAQALKVPVTCLGTVVSGRRGIELEDKSGRKRRWKTRGFDHFRG
jgi:thiamine-monophosphate kinase